MRMIMKLKKKLTWLRTIHNNNNNNKNKHKYLYSKNKQIRYHSKVKNNQEKQYSHKN